MPYKVSFGMIPGPGGLTEPPRQESPFRIAILADFSGRQNRGVTGSSQDILARRLLRVSRDTLDEVIAKMGVELKLPVGDDGDTVNLRFASLDDFHPDQLHDRIDKVADAYESEEKSALMNSVLHHPDFQALESAWRGVAWLLSRTAKGGRVASEVVLGSKVEVLLLDLSLAELTADLKASENLAASAVHQLLIDKAVRGPKGEPWAALVGNYIFDLTGPHVELLGRIAKIARQAVAPFLTTLHPRVLDKSFALDPELGPAWQALRQLPEAGLLGLAVPRFILRLPFGENTQSTDKFSYEEMSRTPDRKHYLWGNPAFACAALLAQGFNKEGWATKPGSVMDLEDLPIHVYTVDDEEEVTMAEAWLVRPQTEQLVRQGIMPFLCVRGKGAMQLSSFHSLALAPKDQPKCELHGHWNPPRAAPPPQPAPPRPAAPGAPPAKGPPAAGAPAARPAGAPAAPARAPAPGAAGAPPRPAAAGAAPAPPRPAAGAAPAPPRPAAAAAPAPPKPAASAPPPRPAAAPAAPAAGAPAAKAAPAPAAPAAQAPPAEEEMDPDLAALLKQLE